MLDDFEPIVHTLEGRTVKVWAVADVHIGARECDLDGFESFLRRIEKEPDSYVMIVGDVLNNGLKDSLTNVYQETMPPSRQVDVAVELLQPVADKILGCVGGNHEHRTTKACDLDPLYQVMALIRKPELYRPNMAFVRVRLGTGKTRDTYGIMLAHGKTANKRKQFQAVVEGIDAAVFAHTHQPDIILPARIRFGTNNRVTVHEIVSLTACSWLKAGGYSLASLYVPQAVSRPQCLILEYTATNTRNGCVRVGW